MSMSMSMVNMDTANTIYNHYSLLQSHHWNAI